MSQWKVLVLGCVRSDTDGRMNFLGRAKGAFFINVQYVLSLSWGGFPVSSTLTLSLYCQRGIICIQ